MQSILERIEAFAKIRLVLPEGRYPKQELSRYRNFIKVQSHRLKVLHRSGASGHEITHMRALMMDVLLRYLLEGIKQQTIKTCKTALPKLSLVATGGYGRQELNPHSDIDIMFLHDGEVMNHGRHHACMSALTESFLLAMFDIGLKVGHSVRTIDDCVIEANKDVQSKTSLLEARLIVGENELFDQLQRVFLAKCVHNYEDAYIAERLKDQSARHAKYGDSASMQEPNIKNGCGGLRDYQNLLWMTYFKYRVRGLAELERRGWIGESEKRQLETAYDFLLRTRTDLHYHVNRPMDILLKGVQPSIANNLGYHDRSPIKRLEKFMRDLYIHMRNVYLITRTVEERLAFMHKPKPRPSLRDMIWLGRKKTEPPMVDGFQILNGEMRAKSTNVFQEQPRRLMRVFLHAQQQGLKLHPDLVQLVRQNLNLANATFLKDVHIHETFCEILGLRGSVAPTLRLMHEVGLLGRFLPEFGRLTCLVQHEFFHRYTADEHTLVCLEMLDSVWTAKNAPFNRYTHLFQKIERPFVLYLALLLHDAGKAIPSRQHSNASVKLALRAAKRLNLDRPSVQSLKTLIEHHLSLIQISQKRDLEDPTVAKKFAKQIQSQSNLDMLLLHTFADSLGTRQDLWSDFKEALVWALYTQTSHVLSGAASTVKIEEKQRELLQNEVRKAILHSCPDDELSAHFAHMPIRYFQIYTAQEIIVDLQLAHDFMLWQVCKEDRALEPAIAWNDAPDRGYSSVRICTWDRAGLFSKIAGSLTAVELSICSARIFSRADGLIFDTFFVVDAITGNLPSREKQQKFDTVLKSVLTEQSELNSVLARLKIGQPIYNYLEGERLPIIVHVDNNTSESHTVVDIETEDRLGLLFTLSKAMSQLDLDISTAKITTEKGAAIDSFYVRDIIKGKITQPERLKNIEIQLRASIANLETSDHA